MLHRVVPEPKKDPLMDRKLILEHLALAEKHVAQAARHLAHQQQIIERLAHDGHDISPAVDVMETLQESQAIHRTELDRLRSELKRH